MEVLKATRTISFGGRVREKGDVFEIGDRQDSLGKVVEGSAKAESDRLVAEGYAEPASDHEMESFRSSKAGDQEKPLDDESPEAFRQRRIREAGGVPETPRITTVSLNSPAPPPPTPPER